MVTERELVEAGICVSMAQARRLKRDMEQQGKLRKKIDKKIDKKLKENGGRS
jgi:predicted phage-related endonuclease